MTVRGIGIAGARTRFAACMTDTVEVLRQGEPIPDGSGGSTYPDPVIATVAARIVASTSQPREEMQGGRLAGVVTYQVYLPWGTDVRPADVLRRGTDRFEVIDDTGARTDGVATVVTVKRVR